MRYTLNVYEKSGFFKQTRLICVAGFLTIEAAENAISRSNHIDKPYTIYDLTGDAIIRKNHK